MARVSKELIVDFCEEFEDMAFFDDESMTKIADELSRDAEDPEQEYSNICKTGLNIGMLREYAKAKGYKWLLCKNVNTWDYGVLDMHFKIV